MRRSFECHPVCCFFSTFIEIDLIRIKNHGSPADHLPGLAHGAVGVHGAGQHVLHELGAVQEQVLGGALRDVEGQPEPLRGLRRAGLREERLGYFLLDCLF